MTGKLKPTLDFHDNKFPMLTVDFNGERYSLEGYHLRPSPHQPSPYLTHFNALLFWDDVDYTCREKGRWHLVCFDTNGNNFGKYANLIVKAGPMVALETRREPLLSGLVGTLTPHLHDLDNKFSFLTVNFQGEEYTLDGLYTPPGADQSDSHRMYRQAQELLADQIFSCDTSHPWHLTCFDENGENIAKHLDSKS